MPKEPHGEKRSVDVIDAAVMVVKIAVGEVETLFPLTAKS